MVEYLAKASISFNIPKTKVSLNDLSDTSSAFAILNLEYLASMNRFLTSAILMLQLNTLNLDTPPLPIVADEYFISKIPDSPKFSMIKSLLNRVKFTFPMMVAIFIFPYLLSTLTARLAGIQII